MMISFLPRRVIVMAALLLGAFLTGFAAVSPEQSGVCPDQYCWGNNFCLTGTTGTRCSWVGAWCYTTLCSVDETQAR